MNKKQLLRRFAEGTSKDKKDSRKEETPKIEKRRRGRFDSEQVDLQEEGGLVNRRHLRAANSVISRGKSFGATVERLPIVNTNGKHFSRPGSRKPKAVEFEGPIEKLVEKYGIAEAPNHFSLGQWQKYDVNEEGIWDCKTGIRLYPVMSWRDKLYLLIEGVNCGHYRTL